MQLFYFRSETHQCIISASCWKSALEKFSAALKEIYGSTLKVIEIGSHDAITVHWREEGTTRMIKDHFEVRLLKEDALFWFSAIGEEPPTLVLPEEEAKKKLKITVNSR